MVDDLTKLCARLNSAGFTCMDDMPLEGFTRTFVADPFGNRIELMQKMNV
ncbi:MAG: VOC family protein [Sneathiella sp.]|nr:VOC family protein [Sneathiella sp.]